MISLAFRFLASIPLTNKQNRVFKILRKSFGSCIPTRKSKGANKDAADLAVQAESKIPEGDELAKDSTEDADEEVEEQEQHEEGESKPDPVGEESAPASPSAVASKSAAEDAPTSDEVAEESSPTEDRDGATEEIAEAENKESPREVVEDASQMEGAKDDGEDYQWEVSCCGVDIPLTK